MNDGKGVFEFVYTTLIRLEEIPAKWRITLGLFQLQSVMEEPGQAVVARHGKASLIRPTILPGEEGVLDKKLENFLVFFFFLNKEKERVLIIEGKI